MRLKVLTEVHQVRSAQEVNTAQQALQPQQIVQSEPSTINWELKTVHSVLLVQTEVYEMNQDQSSQRALVQQQNTALEMSPMTVKPVISVQQVMTTSLNASQELIKTQQLSQHAKIVLQEIIAISTVELA